METNPFWNGVLDTKGIWVVEGVGNFCLYPQKKRGDYTLKINEKSFASKEEAYNHYKKERPDEDD